MTPHLKIVPIDNLLPNPHRYLSDYPFSEGKVLDLMRSIETVGVWESIIVRPAAGDAFELAFGHHRLEAARRLRMSSLPVIVRDLTDGQMLQFLANENGEDFATDFLVLLNTWEAAEKFTRAARRVDTNEATPIETLEIAKIIGWTIRKADGKHPVRPAPSHVAAACAAASSLLAGGHLERSDLRGLSVHSARQICQSATASIRTVRQHARDNRVPHAQAERYIGKVAAATKLTTRQVRAGGVPEREVGRRVVQNVMAQTTKEDPVLPLLDKFVTRLVASVSATLATDALAEQLLQVKRALQEVSPADRTKLHQELLKLASRALQHSKEVAPAKSALTPVRKELSHV